ncbi:MAG: efflux RND transporter periplasmic adaptor subunit [Bythopirellula sp.]
MSANDNTTGRPLLIGLLMIAVAAGAAALTRESWYASLFPDEPVSLLDKLDQHGLEQDHDAHDHGAHGAGAAIALSAQGLKNIGYEPFVVRATSYHRKLNLPAIVVERTGRSQLHITAPLTGIVSKIRAVTGEAVEPGQLLFEVRLTHEELVAAQRDFLRNVENLGVVDREIARLKSLDQGVIAGRRILEQEYEKQKLEASLHAEAQAMLLHGLTEPQVAEIRETRRLFRNVEISAPDHSHHVSCHGDHPFQIHQLTVTQGQQIEAGSHLAVLGDHCELLIEAIAFEDDTREIQAAAQSGSKVTALQLGGSTKDSPIEGLEVLYVADQIDAESRALKVYLQLPNHLVLDKKVGDKRYVEWAFKPGQRMQVQMPVETWDNQLVLPTTAVIDEGAEAYVYQQHGDHFDQVAIHVVHRDRDSVVVESDGALKEGAKIAGKGAFQIHLAIKNQAGGGIDPHAGHNH